MILSSLNPSTHIVGSTHTHGSDELSDINDDLYSSDDNTDTEGAFVAASAASAAGYCDPLTAGGPCIYYIAVVSETLPLSSTPPVFQVTAQTPSSVTLLACEAAAQVSPDGVRVIGTDTTAPSTGSMVRYYEVCPSNGPDRDVALSLIVSMEQCSGHTDIFACDITSDDTPSSSRGGTHCAGSLPSTVDWAYKSDSNQTCARQWQEKKDMISGGWSEEVCSAYAQDAHMPILILPYSTNDDEVSIGGNYYLMTKGVGDFVLRMESGVRNMGAMRIAPRLVPNTVDGKGGGQVSVLSSTEASYPSIITGPLVLSWLPSLVVFTPEPPQIPHLVQYFAYIVLLDAVQGSSESKARLDTQCGLERALSTYPPGTVKVIPLPSPSSLSLLPNNAVSGDSSLTVSDTHMQHLFADSDIPKNRKISISIMAVCDGPCLRSVSMELTAVRTCAMTSVDCKTQAFVYTPLIISSTYGPPPTVRTWFGVLLSVTSWVVLVAVLFMVAVGAKIMYERQTADGSTYGPEDSSSPSTPYVGSLGGSLHSSRGWFGNWGYSQLGFTEMVDTSSFSQSQSPQRPDMRDSVSSNSSELEGDVQSKVPGRQTPAWMHRLAERASPVMGTVATISRTAGCIISDTTSAVYSYVSLRSLSGITSVGGAELDRSTHPLTGDRDGGNSGGYRPPSPLPFNHQGLSFTPSSLSSAPTSIAVTDHVRRGTDTESGPMYTSFRLQQLAASEATSRGSGLFSTTAAAQEEGEGDGEEEEEEEEKHSVGS